MRAIRYGFRAQVQTLSSLISVFLLREVPPNAKEHRARQAQDVVAAWHRYGRVTGLSPVHPQWLERLLHWARCQWAAAGRCALAGATSASLPQAASPQQPGMPRILTVPGRCSFTASPREDGDACTWARFATASCGVWAVFAMGPQQLALQPAASGARAPVASGQHGRRVRVAINVLTDELCSLGHISSITHAHAGYSGVTGASRAWSSGKCGTRERDSSAQKRAFLITTPSKVTSLPSIEWDEPLPRLNGAKSCCYEANSS